LAQSSLGISSPVGYKFQILDLINVSSNTWNPAIGAKDESEEVNATI